MAKKNNEAKVKFTAETGEFNENIKKADKTLGNLRAELNLNETQMKATGATVEGLEQKHSILERQLEASQSKTEAMAAKLEVATRLFGENSAEVMDLQRKLTQAKAAEEKIRQAVDKCNKELDAQKDAAKEASSATKQLTDSIEKQQSEIDDLMVEYKDAVLQYGKNSKEAKELANQLKNLLREIAKSKQELNKANNAADDLSKGVKGAGDSARDAEDGFTVMKGAVSDLVSGAIQWGIGKLGEFTDYLKELPEATRELRQDMATLETSFESAGLSTEQATGTWKELYRIFGEDDRAVEAANLIAKFADNQKDLNSWIEITKGVYGSYQDSLPVEGLAEAANETAKTGAVTGVLADALNWSSDAASMFSKYMSEDVTTAEDAFNEALKECTTEEERQALITETLTKLYGDAAKKYEEASGAQLAEKEAAAEATLAQNNLATAIAPATTAWTNMKTQLVTAVTPAVEKVSGALTDAFNWLQKHPGAMTAVAAAVGALGAALTVLAVAMAVATVKQWLMNAAVLANPITWIVVGIVAAVAALIAIGVALYKNWDKIKAKCTEVWNNVTQKFTAAKTAVVGKVTEMKNNVVNKFNEIKTGITSKVEAVKNGVVNKFNTIRDKITGAINTAKDKVKGAIDKIKGFFSGLKLNLPKIKLPHFKLKGEFSLTKMTVPKLSVEWYAKGGIFTKPTIFPTASGLKGVGDVRGGEAVLPIDRLRGYVAEAIQTSAPQQDLRPLVDAIEELANRPIEFGINGRRFARVTARDTDSENGLRNSLADRGLVLD